MKEEEISLIGSIRNDYETWGDIYNFNGILYCAYTETIDKEDHSETAIIIAVSSDHAKTWQSEILPFRKKGVPYWCRPRFLREDGNRLILFCNLVENIHKSGEIYMLERKQNQWTEPVSLNLYGVLSGNPVMLSNGKVLLPIHEINAASNYYQQSIYQSHDLSTWNQTVYYKTGFDLCDAQIVKKDNRVIILFREKSVSGWDLFMIKSEDNGTNWSNLNKVAFKGGCKFTFESKNDMIYLAFFRDEYNDHRKTLQMASVSFQELFSNQNTAAFNTLIDGDEYETFQKNILGFTGISFDEDSVVLVKVAAYHYKTNIESIYTKMEELLRCMVPYHLKGK